MADNRNLVLQLLITAKDEASAAFGKLFSYLDNNTRVVANAMRAAFTNLFGGGLESAVDFEAQLDRVQAKGSYTQEAMGELAAAARSIGAQFGISGAEAAQGMEALAAAGLTAKDAIGALPSVLALASSEQISADAAAQKLTDSLSIMGLGFEQTSRMADVLAKGANITTSSASQLAEALSEAGGTARAAGMDLESTVAALDLLHKNGIKGSEAGTALKSILTSLLDPASKASTELTALGITSRDLGGVLEQLQAKGGAANAAILAFGTEAGPGLRALLTEGQTGLADYTTQLRDSGGAAEAAADQMSGNLKSAMASLNSAWESLKAALLEPLLEPLARQAKSLSSAFQDMLKSNSIQKVQALLREFGTSIADNINQALESFSFEQAAQRIENFAQAAKGGFVYVETAATATAGAIKSAFNLITAPINAVLASVSSNISALFTLLSGIERQAANVGLGTVERADELLRKAEAAKATALELQAAAKQDVADLMAGASQAGTAIAELDANLAKVKATAETVEPPDFGNAATLTPIIYSLQDLANLLERAKAEQRAAADAADMAEVAYLGQMDALGNLTSTAERFAQAQADNRTAQERLKTATDDVTAAHAAYDVAVQNAIRGITEESTAITANIKTKSQLFAESQRQLDLEQKVATAATTAADAAVETAQAELELARARGDNNAIASASANVIRAEIAALEAKRNTQKIELQQLQDLAARITDLTQRKAILSAVEQEELQRLLQQNPALQQQIQTQQQNIQTTETLIQTRQALGQVTQQNTQDQQKNTEQTKEATKSYTLMEDVATNAAKALAKQSAGMAELLTTLLGLPGAYKAADFWGTKWSGELGELQLRLQQTNDVLQKMQGYVTSVGYDGFEQMANAVNTATKAFLEQEVAAVSMRDALTALVEQSDVNASALAHMVQQAANAKVGFDLLNKERLDQLQDAIDSANDKLREMQEEAQSAKDRLAELNAEIAAERGDEATSERLKLQLEQQQALAEVEAKLAEAQASNNQELIRLYEEQIRKLETLYALKEKNLEQDLKQKQQTQTASSGTSATTTTASGGSGMQTGKVYTLNLTAGNNTLSTQTNADPQQFLDALTQAKARSLA